MTLPPGPALDAVASPHHVNHGVDQGVDLRIANPRVCVRTWACVLVRECVLLVCV